MSALSRTCSFLNDFRLAPGSDLALPSVSRDRITSEKLSTGVKDTSVKSSRQREATFLSGDLNMTVAVSSQRAPRHLIREELARSNDRGLYLFYAALGGAEHEDGVAWDQYHGRQSHEPANHLAPQRVHVLPQGQRGHLNGTEGKNPL